MNRTVMSALAFSIWGAGAQAQTYQVTPIPPPPTGVACAARAVNNFGHVTGWAQVGGTTRVFVYTPTAGSSDIYDMGVSNTQYGGYGINDSDVIVGQYVASSALHAFRWDGAMQDITIDMINLNPPSGYAAAINANGDIGGTLTFRCSNGGAATPLVAAHWAPGGGSVIPLGTYNPDLCYTSSVLGMNNVGDLVGYGYHIIAGFAWQRPTLWHAGMMIELPTFGTHPGHGAVNDINDAGVCVGFAENRNPGTVWTAPCLWRADGTLVNLNPAADPTYTGQANSINNAGLIVGLHGATPVIWTAPGVALPLAGQIVPPVPPGLMLTDVVGISDSGFVVCNGTVPGSGFWSQAFLLTPCTPGVAVPAPDQTVPTMTPVTFSLVAVGAGPIGYQWRKDGVTLSDGPAAGGGVIAGSATSTLTISLVACPDRGVYDCLITTACGAGVSPGAVLNVTGCTCTADFDNDGDVGTDADIAAFYACVAGNCCQACGSADFNGDGDVGTDADFEAFWRVLEGGPCG